MLCRARGKSLRLILKRYVPPRGYFSVDNQQHTDLAQDAAQSTIKRNLRGDAHTEFFSSKMTILCILYDGIGTTTSGGVQTGSSDDNFS